MTRRCVMTDPAAPMLALLLNTVGEDSPPEPRQRLADALESAVPAVSPGADRVHYSTS